MTRDTEEKTGDAAEGPKLSRGSVIGVASLIIIIAISSLRQEETPPSWAHKLPGRIDPPLATPTQPLGQARLSATVLSSEGHPVPNALAYTETGELLSWDYTDADGLFLLEALPAGEVVVRVIGDGHEAEDFTLTAPLEGGELTLTTPLAEAPSLPSLERVAVTVSVTPPRADWGIEGYELWLDPLSPAHEFGAPIPSRATVRADRSVSFEGLLAGHYRAHLLPPWAKNGTWPDLLDSETPLLSIGLSDEAQLELAMTAGEVWGAVIDEGGALVPNALIGLHPEGEPNQVWPPTRTDESGRYVLKDLPIGAYRLSAHAGALSAEHTIQVSDALPSQIDISLHQ